MSSNTNPTTNPSGNVRSDLTGHPPASNLVINDNARAAISRGEDVIHFGFGESPFPVLPHVVEALKANAHRKEYAPVRGFKDLRDGISRFHARVDGSEVDPERMIVGPGSKELIFLLFLAAAEDSVVFLPQPTWLTYAPQVRLAGKRMVQVPTIDAEWKLDPATLDATLAGTECKGLKILVIEYPDNPSGITYREDRLRSIAAVLKKHNTYVISDEIYGPLTFGAQHVSMATICPERTVLSGGLSKWAGAGGWRIGYHCYPPALKDLYDAVVGAASHTYSSASTPIQRAAVAYFDESREADLDAYLLAQRRILSACGKWCRDTLIAAGLSCAVPEGAYYLFPNFESLKPALASKGIVSGEALAQAIQRDTGVVVMPSGPDFLMDENHWTTRLCYVTIRGEEALASVYKIPETEELSVKWLEEFAPKMVDGIRRLAEWSKNVSK